MSISDVVETGTFVLTRKSVQPSVDMGLEKLISDLVWAPVMGVTRALVDETCGALDDLFKELL
jgi:hypothetical protein